MPAPLNKGAFPNEFRPKIGYEGEREENFLKGIFTPQKIFVGTPYSSLLIPFQSNILPGRLRGGEVDIQVLLLIKTATR